MSKHSGQRPILIGTTTTSYNDILSDMNRVSKEILRMQYKSAKSACWLYQLMFWVWLICSVLQSMVLTGFAGVGVALGYCLIAGFQLYMYKKEIIKRDTFLMEILAE